MNDNVRLKRATNKLPLFAGSILRNYLRMCTFDDPKYMKMEQRRIKILINNGTEPPIQSFDENGAITWDGCQIPYNVIVNVVFEETYRYDDLHLSLKFITHIRKNSYVRSVVLLPDGDEKKVVGIPTKNLFFLYDPFISYSIMSTLVRNLDKHKISYTIDYKEFVGLVLEVDNNNKHFKFRTLLGDKSNKLVMVDQKEDLPLTATQAMTIIKRKR